MTGAHLQAKHHGTSVDTLVDEDQRHQQLQEAQRHQREQSHGEHPTGAKHRYREDTDELNNDPENVDAKSHMSSDEKYRRLKKKLKEVLEVTTLYTSLSWRTSDLNPSTNRSPYSPVLSICHCRKTFA